MMRWLLLMTIAVAAAGCGKSAKDAQSNAPSIAAAEQADHAGQAGAAADQQAGAAAGRPPFAGDRVIKLNAIVRRSLDLSKEFDAQAPSIRAAVDAAAAGGDLAAAEAGVQTISDFHDRAKAALDDMVAAEAELKESGEYFDTAIFYSMMKFVADIETELREEKAALAAKLGK